jgi:hypothetical protein
MRRFIPASFVLALGFPLAALADTASDINALRQEIETIRSSYEQRLQSLEQRLKAAEAQAPAAVAVAAAPAAPPGPSGGPNAFNPAISLILSGTYGRTTRDPATYALSRPVPGGAFFAARRPATPARSGAASAWLKPSSD